LKKQRNRISCQFGHHTRPGYKFNPAANNIFGMIHAKGNKKNAGFSLTRIMRKNGKIRNE